MPQVEHDTLVAATVKTETFTGAHEVEIVNRSATDEIFVRTDGTDPTVGGANCEIVLPGGFVDMAMEGSALVKLISSGTPSYSVTVIR